MLMWRRKFYTFCERGTVMLITEILLKKSLSEISFTVQKIKFSIKDFFSKCKISSVNVKPLHIYQRNC